jgi:uncharacterized protein YecE (DUF72 family)
MTAKPATANSGTIRIGVGGWTFAPWRGVFYPHGLPQAQELAYAASRLSSIEVNATFYRTQSAATFRKWASVVPEGFLFSVKAPRYTTHRRELTDAADAIKAFLDSGVLELGDRLGPLLWQFAPTKKFASSEFGKFLEMLPPSLGGHKLRHVVEARHDSFVTPEFIALLRSFAVAGVYAEHESYPEFADLTADFVYARLQKAKDTVRTGYPSRALDTWTARLQAWAEGSEPGDLPRIDRRHRPEKKPRDVFAYVIHEGKLRAPAAAMALIERLKR